MGITQLTTLALTWLEGCGDKNPAAGTTATVPAAPAANDVATVAEAATPHAAQNADTYVPPYYRPMY